MTIQARFQLRRGVFSLDVDLTLPSTGVTALFGPSGCGKTTLLRCVSGLEQVSGGFLAVGEEVWQDDQVFVPTHKRRLGYVFQDIRLFPHLSVRGNLDYVRKRARYRKGQIDYYDTVSLLGIETFLDQDPARLSGGERQRVAVARALLACPKLLLMDEPLAALDATSKAEILPYLERLHHELAIPVVYVSHSVDDVARIADHMALMRQGRIVATGPLATMLTRLDLSPAHGADAEAVIEATVCGHDEEYHLTRLEFRGRTLLIPKQQLRAGDAVRLRIQARDVSLTRDRQENTSILNIFAARVMEFADEGPANVMVRLDADGVSLLSRITRKSAAHLDLTIGSELYAQVKSVALLP